MGKKIDLNKSEVAEVVGSGLEITLSIESSESICIQFSSETGGRQIGVRAHPENSSALEIYLKPQANHGFKLV